MKFKKTSVYARILSSLLIVGLIVSSCPVTAMAADVDSSAITYENLNANFTEEETPVAQDANVSSIPVDDAISEDVVVEDKEQPPEIKTVSDNTKEEVKVAPVVFDHYFSEINTDLVKTTSLLVQTTDSSILTKNTNVVSNYDDTYVIECSSIEEARYVYSYYVDKAINITDMSNIISIAEETVSTDVADLTDVNNGTDPISAITEITPTDLTGYIALIDTGANADINYSVVGEDTADHNGHGTRMFEYIKAENSNAKVVSIKAFDGSSASAADIYAAIQLAIGSKVSYINMSFVGYNIEQNAIVKDAIRDAIDQGITVIGAAGNYNASSKSFIPGCIDEVISVGSANTDGTKYASSNFDADLYVVAVSTSEASARYSGMYSAQNTENDRVFTTLTGNKDDNSGTTSDNTISDNEEDRDPTITHDDKKVA